MCGIDKWVQRDDAPSTTTLGMLLRAALSMVPLASGLAAALAPPGCADSRRGPGRAVQRGAGEISS